MLLKNKIFIFLFLSILLLFSSTSYASFEVEIDNNFVSLPDLPDVFGDKDEHAFDGYLIIKGSVPYSYDNSLYHLYVYNSDKVLANNKNFDLTNYGSTMYTYHLIDNNWKSFGTNNEFNFYFDTYSYYTSNDIYDTSGELVFQGAPAQVVKIPGIQQVEEIPQVMEQVLRILIPIGLIVFLIGLVIYLTRLVISRVQ